VTYRDRRAAGADLARRLAAFAGRSDVVVLGLVRGGVPVAVEVAARLNAPLDVLIVRKLGVPWAPEVAFGALGPAGVKVLNQPTPPAFRESVKVGEQNLYTRAKELVGDRNPREHEFSIQMRSMDADKSGAGLGLPVLVALCGGLLGRNTRGGTVIVGALNLGGSLELIPNAVALAELAVDKQAQTLLMPVAARRQLNDLPDELWTKIKIEFYKDASDAVFKALVE